MDPLRAALAPPPDSRSDLLRLRAVRTAWLRDYRALRRRGCPDAANVVLALDPVLVLDEGFEAYGALLDDSLHSAPEAGPDVHAGLLRAHGRYWSLRGARRVACSSVASARQIASATHGDDPIAGALLTFVGVHSAYGLGLATDLEREARALEELARKARGTQARLRIQALAGKAVGFLAMLRGAHPQAVCAFEEAIDWARRAGTDRTLAIALMSLANALREQGEHDRCESSLRQSLALFRSLDDHVHAARVEGSLLLLSTRRAPLHVPALLRVIETAAGLGDAQTSASLLLTLLERDGGGSGERARTWLDRAWSMLARVDAPGLETRARRLAELWGPASGSEASILEVACDGSAATFDGCVIDLRSRRALPNVLLALALARSESEGAYVSVNGLFAAGWPGEKAQQEAAAARVYMAIRALRSLGLRAAIRTAPAGYRIEPEIAVHIAAARSPLPPRTPRSGRDPR